MDWAELQEIQQACQSPYFQGSTDDVVDILLVRMTSDSLKPLDKRYGYRNALSGLMNLLGEEGVKGLFRGLGTNAVRTP